MATQAEINEINRLYPKEQVALNSELQNKVNGGVTSVTSTDIAPVSTPNFQTPTLPPATSPSTIDATLPELKLSPSEQAASDTIKQLTELQNKNLGKTTFTTEQEKLQGKPELLKTQEDTASQILMLQAQEKNIDAEMQKQSIGRGITAGGLAPLTQAAKYDLGIQANLLSAKLLATQGKLASAQARIDQAIKEKFGPQEEEIKAKLANLELLLKDPTIDLATKNRANAQALLLKQKEQEIANTKQNASDIWKLSIDAATNVSNFKATSEYPSASLALKAIQAAKTKEDALGIATETGLTKQPVALSDFEQAFLREKGRLPTTTELLGFKQKQEKANVSVVTLNDRAIEITRDPTTGKEVGRRDLGPAGKISEAEKKSQFIQALSLVPENTKTKDELKQAALSVGLSPEDKDVVAAIDQVKTKQGGIVGSIRKFFGF